jgi:asparagine N-glycosylation enzyme membrane subunit Stt3
MSDILDESLVKKGKRAQLCGTFRNITIVFSGACLLLFLLFKISHWPGASVLLSAGILSILLQTVACFLAKERKTLRNGLWVIIVILFTSYLLLKYSRIVDIF